MFSLGQGVRLEGNAGVVRALRTELLDNGGTRDVVTIAYLENEAVVLREVDLARADVVAAEGAPPELVPAPVLRSAIPKWEFRQRFTPQEQFDADALAETDPIMRAIVKHLGDVDLVHLDHPATLQGVGYMRIRGVLVNDARVDAILSGA